MKKRSLATILISGVLSAFPLLAQPLPPATLSARVEQAEARLMKMRSALGLGEQHTFVMKRSTQDVLGQVHARFSQYYKGIRVWGGEAVAHMDAQGRELPMTSSLRADMELDVTPALSRVDAIAVVEADLGSKGPYAVPPAVELVIYPETSREVLSTRAHLPKSQINAMDMVERVKGYALAYYVRTVLENPGDTRHTDYLVDARTGAVIEKWDSLQTSNALGTGRSQYSGAVGLNTNSVAGGYEMRDLTRPASGGNVVYNLNHGTSGTGTLICRFLPPQEAESPTDHREGDGEALPTLRPRACHVD